MCFFPFESQPTIIFTAIKIAVNLRLITKLINIRHDVGIPYIRSLKIPLLKQILIENIQLNHSQYQYGVLFFIVTESR